MVEFKELTINIVMFFSYIVEQILNVPVEFSVRNNQPFKIHDVTDLCNVDYHDKFWVYSLRWGNKYEIFDNIKSHIFIDSQKLQSWEGCFMRAQKTLFAFQKLLYIIKINKMVKYNCNHDLLLTPFEDINPIYKLSLVHENTVYDFNVLDLIKIIYRNLTTSNEMFSFPLMPKNPYNNIKFTYANLCNIYFFAKERQIMIGELFEHFYRSNFSISQLSEKEDVFLRNVAIIEWCKNATLEDKYNTIIKMLQENEFVMRHIFIHIRFPDHIVVNRFKNELLLYMQAKYSYSSTKKINSIDKLNYMLYKFAVNEPKFGRIIHHNNSQTRIDEHEHSNVLVNHDENFFSL